MTVPTLATLVIGGTAALREAGIAAQLQDDGSTAVILEGLPSGSDAFQAHPQLAIHRIAPGCAHCTGNLVMRVTLNRILRTRPLRLYISLATSEHLAAIRDFLSSPEYAAWLTLGDELSYT